jgi:acylphosphatase
MNMKKICVKAMVSGRVQGVFFRQSTQQQAQLLNITGHAINLPDGRVEVLACGTETAIKQLLIWLDHGPEMAQVSKVEFQEIQTSDPASFITG